MVLMKCLIYYKYRHGKPSRSFTYHVLFQSDCSSSYRFVCNSLQSYDEDQVKRLTSEGEIVEVNADDPNLCKTCLNRLSQKECHAHMKPPRGLNERQVEGWIEAMNFNKNYQKCLHCNGFKKVVS